MEIRIKINNQIFISIIVFLVIGFIVFYSMKFWESKQEKIHKIFNYSEIQDIDINNLKIIPPNLETIVESINLQTEELTTTLLLDALPEFRDLIHSFYGSEYTYIKGYLKNAPEKTQRNNDSNQNHKYYYLNLTGSIDSNDNDSYDLTFFSDNSEDINISTCTINRTAIPKNIQDYIMSIALENNEIESFILTYPNIYTNFNWRTEKDSLCLNRSNATPDKIQITLLSSKGQLLDPNIPTPKSLTFFFDIKKNQIEL
jgi:hypothetical protein